MGSGRTYRSEHLIVISNQKFSDRDGPPRARSALVRAGPALQPRGGLDGPLQLGGIAAPVTFVPQNL